VTDVGSTRRYRRAIVGLLVTVLTGPWSFEIARIELSHPSPIDGSVTRWTTSPLSVRVTRVQPWAKIDAPVLRLDDQEPGEEGNGAESTRISLELFQSISPSPSFHGLISAVAAANGLRTAPVERLCRFRC
jgi:hypothetical protein